MLKIRRFLKYEKCIKCKKEFLSLGVKRVNEKVYPKLAQLYRYGRGNIKADNALALE